MDYMPRIPHYPPNGMSEVCTSEVCAGVSISTLLFLLFIFVLRAFRQARKESKKGDKHDQEQGNEK